MKDKTKNTLKAILTIVLKIAKFIIGKKGLTLLLLLAVIYCVSACVNGQMIVIKGLSSGLELKADSTGIVEIKLLSDTIKEAESLER